MFVLEVLRVVITLPSSALLVPKDIPAAICHEIDTHYPNRVLEQIGLIIATRVPIIPLQSSHVLRISQGVCVHAETAFPVQFTALVFRPRPSEILTGIIVEMNETDGIRVSMGFFANIWIPKHNLLHPSRYEKGVWVWIPEYDDDDDNEDDKEEDNHPDASTKGTNGGSIQLHGTKDHTTTNGGTGNEAATRYEMNLGSSIRFRVQQVLFPKPRIRQKTTLPSILGDTTGGYDTSGLDHPNTNTTISAMQIVASICEDGLGLIDWWKEEEEETTEVENEEIVKEED
jgi:DNA-directed RNA polymerase subunit E'/Rpb7